MSWSCWSRGFHCVLVMVWVGIYSFRSQSALLCKYFSSHFYSITFTFRFIWNLLEKMLITTMAFELSLLVIRLLEDCTETIMILWACILFLSLSLSPLKICGCRSNWAMLYIYLSFEQYPILDNITNNVLYKAKDFPVLTNCCFIPRI